MNETTGTTGTTVGTAGTVVRPWRWPARLLTQLVVLGGLSSLVALITSAVSGSAVASVAVGLPLAALAVWVYRRVVRITEKRDATELGRTGLRDGLARGTGIGIAVCAAVIALLAVFGAYRIVGWGSLGGLVGVLGMMAAVAVGEELLMRGVLFRLLEELSGTWGALAVSALVFGALHLVNPGATVWGSFAIAVEGGLMIGAAFVATRSLWLPIGLHFGWNVALGGLFGAVVSGSDSTGHGLLVAALEGPAALTGGTVGPEASVVALVVCAVPTVLLLRRARRAGHIRPRRGVVAA
jgi:uncharacterized protein